MQRLQQVITLEVVPAERHLMKVVVTRAFSNLGREGRLSLLPTKQKAPIDFIACHPHVTTKAVTCDNVMHGFLEAGYIDTKKIQHQDFNKILRTFLRDPTNDEYNLCKDSFKDFMKFYLKHGHVTDDHFEELDYHMDNDPRGNKVRREAGITQETRQRAKILTHTHQCEFRKSTELAIESESRRKAKERRDIIVEIFHE